MSSEGDDGDINEVHALVRRVLQSRSASWRGLADRAQAIRSAISSEIARNIEPVINREVSQRPQDTLQEKRQLAAWLNHELHQLGLAISCGEERVPGILVALPGRDNHDESSRFRVEARDAQGRKTRSASLAWVPELHLVVDPPRREGGSRYRG